MKKNLEKNAIIKHWSADRSIYSIELSTTTTLHHFPGIMQKFIKFFSLYEMWMWWNIPIFNRKLFCWNLKIDRKMKILKTSATNIEKSHIRKKKQIKMQTRFGWQRKIVALIINRKANAWIIFHTSSGHKLKML